MNYPFIEISEVANFINGFPFKPEDWESTGLPIIRIQNLTDEDKPYNCTKRSVPKKYLIKKGDILISWSATIDVFEWNQGDALLNQHIFKVDFARERIDKQYFKKALKRTILELSKYAHGSTMKHVVKSDFESHKIPLPPLNDQIRIAHLLGKVEGLIAQRKQHLQQLDNMLKSVFLEMFGPNCHGYKMWPLVDIRDLAAKKKGAMRTGPFGSNLLHSEFTQEGDVAVLGIDNAVQNRFAWGERRFISKEKYEDLSSYRTYPGDIIITIMGTIGRSAVIPDDIPLAINTKHLAAITLDRDLANPLFLSYSIHSDPLVINQFKIKNRGAIMGGLNLGIIKETKLKRPPIELQNQFADIHRRVDELKALYQQSLTDLESLYGALSQKAFKGELDLSRVPLLASADEEQPIAMHQRQQELFEKAG